ncbi:hypothetical protein EDB89DRAFT_1900226 [Lactarius sanguifluus]|nr:hypothetical protein EDB89DRAFT_1900226 [Lactarius sanguifluus]
MVRCVIVVVGMVVVIAATARCVTSVASKLLSNSSASCHVLHFGVGTSHLTFVAQAMQLDLQCQWWGSGSISWKLDRLGLVKLLMMSSLFIVLAKSQFPKVGPNHDNGSNSSDGDHDTTVDDKAMLTATMPG